MLLNAAHTPISSRIPTAWPRAPNSDRPDAKRLRRSRVLCTNVIITASGPLDETSAAMRRVNPAITWREWLIAPAYQQAETGDNSLIQELQALFSAPYDTPVDDQASRYDQLRPQEFFRAGGISHYSCSS